MRRPPAATPPENLRENNYVKSRYHYSSSLSFKLLFILIIVISFYEAGKVSAQVIQPGPNQQPNIQAQQQAGVLFTGTGTNAFYGGWLDFGFIIN